MLNRRQMYQQCYGGPAGAADSSRVLVDDLLTNMFFDVNLNAMLRLRYVIRSRCASLLKFIIFFSNDTYIHIQVPNGDARYDSVRYIKCQALICRAW